MAKLSLKRRDMLAASKFALPDQRKYPVEDKSHAANAKARATQQVGKSISKSQEEEIDSKANKILGKGKT